MGINKARSRVIYINLAKRMTEMYSEEEIKKRIHYVSYRSGPGVYSPEELIALSRRYRDHFISAQESKAVIFDIEQIQVFWKLIKSGKFLPEIDYRLPFPHTWIEFSAHLALDESIEDELGHVGLLLSQYDTFNRMIIVHEEFDDEVVLWDSINPAHMGVSVLGDSSVRANQFRLLAFACIAYINCENIYLAREGGADEATNARRVRKGKSRLEPYYTCRIRGVEYDAHGQATGEGSKHGIRYDVRGHFRRLESGKTTWVRPHQRGLTNELYVPKTYVVDRVN